MTKNKKKKISLIARLRNYFFTGVIVLVPIGFTLYLTIFLVSVSSNLIPEEINPNNYLPFSIPGLEIAVSIIFITLIGGLSLSFIGKKILRLINDLLKKIPILRTIYSAIGQMTESFTNNKKGKKSVVLVQYPEKVHGQLVLLLRIIKVKLQKKQTNNLSMYLFQQLQIQQVDFY